MNRQVLWDATSQDNPPRHDYTFIIYGDSSMFNSVCARFQEQAQPTEDRTLVTQGRVNGTGLKYYIATITSFGVDPTRFPEIQKKVYGGSMKRDTEISQYRLNPDTLVKRVEEKAGEGKYF